MTRKKIKNSIQQDIKTGDGSHNIQVQTLVVQQGITYSEVEKIAKNTFDVLFEQNVTKLSNIAEIKAVERKEQFKNDFFDRINEDKNIKMEVFSDPSFQYAIVEAQKSYIKLGKQNLTDVLVDMLVERAKNEDRSLKQIVLEESLLTLPKLTDRQLDTLTIVFIFIYSSNSDVVNLETFKRFLEYNVKPFVSTLSKEQSLYQHLAFSSCASINLTVNSLESILVQTYKGIFTHGFIETDFGTNSELIKKLKEKNVIIRCLDNSEKLQLNAINVDLLKEILNSHKFEKSEIEVAVNIFNRYNFSDTEIRKVLLSVSGSFMENLVDIWDTSLIRNLSLTSVGIAIAQANYKRRTGVSVDLGIWIK